MSSVFEGKSITKTILKIGLLIIMSIACVFGMGGSSVIARQLGEGNKDYSAKCLNFCIYSIAIAGPLTLALGLLVLTPFSYVIGADDGNLGYTRDYLKWIFMGAPFVMLANGFPHVLRAIGLIKESAIGIVIGNAINIVLDWVFIVLLHMGTAGAALATSIGFLCAAFGVALGVVFTVLILVFCTLKLLFCEMWRCLFPG